ncbi:MAG: phosphoglucosamine mutase [Phycisphaerae bacterium]|nr:phosphoglucosamine mutase [Phycisphaerae bacterium]
MSDAPLMLSVSGMRGLVGQSLTDAVAARYAWAVGSWLREQARGRGPARVVVGRDSRPSGPAVEAAAITGLRSAGCDVTVLGLATTPATAVMVTELGGRGGLVITASHNPLPWNGIKTLRHDGVAPPPEQARQIIERFHRAPPALPTAAEGTPDTDDRAGAVHVGRILDHLDVEAIRRRRLRVVLDSVCGAGGPSTRQLLEELGVELVHLNAEPTGEFPHEPEPTAANLGGLVQAVEQHGADVGFAQDPDADRLAIVDNRGRYIGEEYTLILCAANILARTAGPVAANLSSSRMLDDLAARFGVQAHRTPVGEAHVARAMGKHACVIGGEGNGGVIWPKIVRVRDSLASIGLVLDLLARDGRPLAEVVDRIPAYSIRKEKIPIEAGMAEAAVKKLSAAFADQKIDTQDGIRIDWPDQWVHVRPSNTEPILRLIAEAPDAQRAGGLLEQVRQAVAGA